jgi:hypothetical protein
MGGEMSTVVFAAYGVTIEIAVDEPRLVPSVLATLPPGWEDGDPARVIARFVLSSTALSADGATVLTGVDETAALAALDSAVRSVVALNAPERVFVHAGVVGHEGLAIVLPGATWSGKTTLVAALLRAGATYFSDEFAVLDREGRVHPYPKPLSVRSPGTSSQVEVPAEQLGPVASGPAEVAVIALTAYRGLETNLRPGTAGGGALALIGHAVAARTRPAAVLEAACAAATEALFLDGPRGEADSTARALLALNHRPRDRASSARLVVRGVTHALDQGKTSQE